MPGATPTKTNKRQVLTLNRAIPLILPPAPSEVGIPQKHSIGIENFRFIWYSFDLRMLKHLTAVSKFSGLSTRDWGRAGEADNAGSASEIGTLSDESLLS